MIINSLTKKEKEILEIFLNSENALSVKNILDNNSSLNKNTVPVIVRQLLNKELIKVDHIGRSGTTFSRFYTPTVTLSEYLKWTIQDISNVKYDQLMKSFVSGNDSIEELDYLENLIKERKKKLQE